MRRAAGIIRRTCDEEVASTKEHKLSVLLSFIKAIQDNELERARTLQKKCAALRQASVNEHTRFTDAFLKIKDMAVELMHISIKERAEELQRTKASLPEAVVEERKKGIAKSLKSLLPAGSKDIAAIQDADGNIWTNDADIADVLNQHWQKTFDKKETNEQLRRVWLQ